MKMKCRFLIGLGDDDFDIIINFIEIIILIEVKIIRKTMVSKYLIIYIQSLLWETFWDDTLAHKELIDLI